MNIALSFSTKVEYKSGRYAVLKFRFFNCLEQGGPFPSVRTIILPASKDIIGAMKLIQKSRRVSLQVFCLAALAALLAACTGTPGTQDDQMGRFFVAPDKYLLYNCDQLQVAALAMRKRELELEGLIARAGTDAAGKLAADMAYRPEYYQTHGQMNELRRTSTEKNCKFVPGEAPADAKPAPAHIRIKR